MSRLSTPEKHQLKIARETMRMHCAATLIMGGPNHAESVKIIMRLTGKKVQLDSDCTCK